MDRKKKKTKKYSGFTLVEMLITMAVMSLIFLAMGSLMENMLRTSNTVSSRMIVREEGEFMAEVLRKYVRNSSVDGVKLYQRSDGVINFDDNYEVTGIGGTPVLNNDSATEMHFRPSGDSEGKVVCIGFFEDSEDRGYIVRTVNELTVPWDNYQPSGCFPSTPDQDFRKNFVILNSDLIFVEDFEIGRTQTASNVYYSFDIDMKPAWGLGGASNYRDEDDSPRYRKSFVVQTRQIFYR